MDDLFRHQTMKITVQAIDPATARYALDDSAFKEIIDTTKRVIDRADAYETDMSMVVHLDNRNHYYPRWFPLTGYEDAEVVVTQHDLVVLETKNGFKVTVRFVGGHNGFDVDPRKTPKKDT